MKKIFTILLVLITITAVAQQKPKQNISGLNIRAVVPDQFQVDSTLYWPLNDTTRLPGRQGASRYRVGDGLYLYNGTAWFKLGSAGDTVSLNNRINLKLNISDTANMLLPFMRKADTASMLATYLPKSLLSGNIFVGNDSDIATGVPITGDISMTNAGVTVIGLGVIDYTKIQNVAPQRLLGRFSGVGGTIQEITLGTGLTLNTSTGVLTSNGGGGDISGSNGLTKVVNDIQLGGTLSSNTTIGTNDRDLTINGSVGSIDIGKRNSFITTTPENITIRAGNTSGILYKTIHLAGDSLGVGIYVYDDIDSLGLTYEHDYSENGLLFDRWIPDIAAVRRVISDNGDNFLINGGNTLDPSATIQMGSAPGSNNPVSIIVNGVPVATNYLSASPSNPFTYTYMPGIMELGKYLIVNGYIVLGTQSSTIPLGSIGQMFTRKSNNFRKQGIWVNVDSAWSQLMVSDTFGNYNAKGIINWVNLQNAPISAKNGDTYFDTTLFKYRGYLSGNWRNFLTDFDSLNYNNTIFSSRPFIPTMIGQLVDNVGLITNTNIYPYLTDNITFLADSVLLGPSLINTPTATGKDSLDVNASIVGFLANNQTWTGNDTLTGRVVIPTVSTGDSSNNASTTAWVKRQGYGSGGGGSGISTLNTLTASIQTFATGTSGSDFNISSATSTHTFNLPTASASNRGLLNTSDWSAFNGKQAALSGTGIVSFSGTTPSYNTTSSSIFSIIGDETGGSGVLMGNVSPTINTSLGIGAAPSSDYLVEMSGTSTADNSRIIDISNANNAGTEDIYNIYNDLTGNYGTLTAGIGLKTLYESITPTASLQGTSGAQTLDARSVDCNIDLSNVSIGTSSATSTIQALGGSFVIAGTPSISDATTTGLDQIVGYGLYSSIGLTPTYTGADDVNYTTYGAYIDNGSAFSGNANVFSNMYGIQSSVHGNLTTTGSTAHYGYDLAVSGTADNNIGIQINVGGATTNNSALLIATPSVGSTNYAINSTATAKSYFAGNVGIGTTTDPTTSLLLLGAGTTTVAPQKYTSGSFMTTASAGSVEYKGTAFGETKSSGLRYTKGGVIANFQTDTANNIGIGETDLYSYSIVGNTLGANGDMIEAEFVVDFEAAVPATTTQDVSVYFGSNQIPVVSAIAVSGTPSRIRMSIIRISNTVARIMVDASTSGGITLNTTDTYQQITSGFSFSTANTIKITGNSTGTGADSGDVIARMGNIKWYAAANN